MFLIFISKKKDVGEEKRNRNVKINDCDGKKGRRMACLSLHLTPELFLFFFSLALFA